MSNKEQKKKVLPFSCFRKKQMERIREVEGERMRQRQEEKMRQRKEREQKRDDLRQKYNLPKSKHLTVQ